MTIQNEGPKIGDPEEPNGFSHSEINEAFKPLSPGDNGMRGSDQYDQIATRWESGVQVFAARIRRSSAGAWEGPAAEQARQAIDNYAKRAEELVPALHALSVQVYESVVSIMRTQNNLPDVPGDKSWYNPSGWSWLPFYEDNDRSDAEEVARRVMGDHYVQTFTQADTKIPVLPVPVNPTSPLHTDLPVDNGDRPGPGGPGDSSTGPGDVPNGTDTGVPEGENPAGEEQPGENPAGEEPGTSQPQPAVPGTEPAGTTDIPQAPLGTTPSTSTTPSATASPGIATPSVPGGAPSGMPEPGRTVPGTPNTAGAPVSGTPAAANAGAARSGMPGMMSPGAGGRGQQGQDDGRHQTPDYLINAENAEELLGEQAPTIPGGVLGGEAPAAQPPRDA